MTCVKGYWWLVLCVTTLQYTGFGKIQDLLFNDLSLFSFLLQHIVYFVKFLISYLIPDISDETKDKIKREKYLIQKLLHEKHLKFAKKKEMGSLADDILKGVNHRSAHKID